MNDLYKLQIATESAVKDAMSAMDMLAEALNKFGIAIIQALLPALEIIRYFPRLPGEHPVDYVLRRGPESGHSIYPDEAWRFRANLDWWAGDDTPDQWGTGWRREH